MANSMTTKPRKPLLVNLTLASVLFFVLPALYLASYGPYTWLKTSGSFRSDILTWMYGPAIRYQYSELPGSDRYAAYLDWFWKDGMDSREP